MRVPSVESREFAPRHTGSWLIPLSGHWIDAARTHLSDHTALVRVTVTALRGSTPREAGATMLVDAVGTVGTIGGGRLEWHATTLARELLRDSRGTPVQTVDLVLGLELGQCCGGRVELWLERLTRRRSCLAGRRIAPFARGARTGGGQRNDRWRRYASAAAALVRRGGGGKLERRAPQRVTLIEMPRPRRPDLWIFGAGHVGQALVRLLAELALFEITWIDSRAGLLPPCLPESVAPKVCAAPAELAAAAPAGTRFVVMTHDHALDYELCRVILARADAAWLGLIGSASKSARFRSRLLRGGLSRETVSGLTCPIGVPGVSSKLPGAIAIAISAQLLQQATPKPPRGASSGVRAEMDAPGCAGGCSSCAPERHKTQ